MTFTRIILLDSFRWIRRKKTQFICSVPSTNQILKSEFLMEKQTSQRLVTVQIPLKFLLLIWSRLYSLLPSVSSSVNTSHRDTSSAKATSIKQETFFIAQHQGHKGQKGRERARQHETCTATFSVALRRYFSPGHWHCVQKSAKKNIPALQRAPVPRQCVRNEKKSNAVSHFFHITGALYRTGNLETVVHRINNCFQEVGTGKPR